MDVREIKTYCLMVDKEEAKKIDQCLAYCNHRLIDHPHSGMHKAAVKFEDVTYFRSKMKEILEVL